jgi:hypothetical protein
MEVNAPNAQVFTLCMKEAVYFHARLLSMKHLTQQKARLVFQTLCLQTELVLLAALSVKMMFAFHVPQVTYFS